MIGALLAVAAVAGARYNVLINCKDSKDAAFAATARAAADAALARADKAQNTAAAALDRVLTE